MIIIIRDGSIWNEVVAIFTAIIAVVACLFCLSFLGVFAALLFGLELSWVLFVPAVIFSIPAAYVAYTEQKRGF